MSSRNVDFAGAGLTGLLDALLSRGASGQTLHVRLREGGGWEVRNPAERPSVKVMQADMNMAEKALAIGSDLRRAWDLALLFAEHREAALAHHAPQRPLAAD